MSQDYTRKNYVADAAISKENDDRFQRFGFSKRIAQTIIQNNINESIVIGIYGRWGEGKTSVLNFIENCLLEDKNIVTCRFNPWRFKDEDNLLTNFFRLIASKLDKSITTKAEKISEKIIEYESIINPYSSLVGRATGFNIWKYISGAAKKIGSVDIDEQKKRIEGILKNEKKKMVVFIDDIDRLDKKEIQAIFRLIKLTGDFSFITYVLAFDEQMVAKAIGESFAGNGGFEDGRVFLEKIIQVPLQLPRATEVALKKFCFDLIDKMLTLNNIKLTSAEAKRFTTDFTTSMLPMLTTPRMAIRYVNSLSFSLPILHREVNTVDLMLLEAIKIFYSELYIFIRDNSKYFLISPKRYASSAFSSHGYDKAKNEYNEAIGGVLKKYPKVETSIKVTLTDMFPVIDELYYNRVHHEGHFLKWDQDQRIGSTNYFQRYFSYAVLEGDVPDVAIENYLNDLNNGTISDSYAITDKFISQNNTETLMFKLGKRETKYSPELSEKLLLSFSRLGSKFPYYQNALWGFTTPLGELANFIFKLILNNPNRNSQLKLLDEVIENTDSFELLYELRAWILHYKVDGQKVELYTSEEFKEIHKKILSKALNLAGDTPLFEKFTRNATYLLTGVWREVVGKESLNSYIKNILDKSPEKIYNLLKAYSPYASNSLSSGPYYSDITKDYYEVIDKTFDIDYLYSIAKLLYKGDINSIQYLELDHEQTDENRLKQFMYFYGESNKDILVK